MASHSSDRLTSGSASAAQPDDRNRASGSGSAVTTGESPAVSPESPEGFASAADSGGRQEGAEHNHPASSAAELSPDAGVISKGNADMDVCSVRCIHPDVVRRVQAGMSGEELLADVADFLRVFGDTTRVRILDALRQEEMCVCDLAALLGMTISAVSHQLRVLRAARVVRSRRAGRVIYYSLDDSHVESLLDQAMAHIRHG